MKKVKLSSVVVFIFFAALFFAVFFAERSQSKESLYDVFRTEVSDILYCASPDKKSYEFMSDSVFFVLEERNQEMMISIFIGAPGQEKSKLIWVIEERRLNEKNVSDLAERAAYIILYHLSKGAIVPPSAKEPIAI